MTWAQKLDCVNNVQRDHPHCACSPDGDGIIDSMIYHKHTIALYYDNLVPVCV